MEPFREAAREAATQLGHQPVMAEDFGAQPTSPQIACLQGLRQSAAVVLILGAAYGAKQRVPIKTSRSMAHDPITGSPDPRSNRFASSHHHPRLSSTSST
jgi:Domain of unknown function (DUF4062)